MQKDSYCKTIWCCGICGLCAHLHFDRKAHFVLSLVCGSQKICVVTDLLPEKPRRWTTMQSGKQMHAFLLPKLVYAVNQKARFQLQLRITNSFYTLLEDNTL